MRSTRVYEALRRAVLEGELVPGQRLVLRELANRYGVSDVPVREALRMLQRDGLIEMLPYRGARVVVLSPEEVEEAYLIRGQLESLAAAEAVAHLKDSDVVQLKDCLRRMVHVIEQGDSVAYAELNREFHGVILGACPYRRLTELILNLWDGQAGYQTVFRLAPERVRESFEEHKQILELLLSGDKEGVARATKDHRSAASRELVRSLRERKVYGESDSAEQNDAVPLAGGNNHRCAVQRGL